MHSDTAPAPAGKTAAALQAKFCAVIAPAVERHAAVAFRGHGREAVMEAQAACVALAWKWHVRLEERGKDATAFPTAIATLAAKHVMAGRGVCGQRTRDVMSKIAQQRHGFGVSKLPEFSTLGSNQLQDALIDTRQASVVDNVVFRIDIPAWLATLTDRDRRMIEDMALGFSTKSLSDKYTVSASRISQLRRAYVESYERFQGMAA